MVNLGEGHAITFDISFTNPSCFTSIQSGAHLKEDKAGEKRESVKRAKYGHLEGMGEGEDKGLTPFVIESTGRLGPTARAFMKKIVSIGEVAQAISYFYNALSSMTALYNSLMLKGARRKLRSLETIEF